MPGANSAPNSPLIRARKGENDVNSSYDTGSVKSDRPQSILKKRNNDLNSSFNSEYDS